MAQPRPLLIQPEDQTVKLIALTRGRVAVVDADRYEWAMQWNWHAAYNSSSQAYYAARHGRRRDGESSCKMFYLHRQLLGEPDAEVDHWSGDTLDCRIANLRACTRSQNGANRRLPQNNTSGCLGVCWRKDNRKWRAQIRVNGKTIHIGYFEFQSDAATARELAEEKYFGEYAYSARKDVMPVEAHQPEENRYV